MARKKQKNQLVVRGVMKRGRVELLDDVKIANGSLLDIAVVETPDAKGIMTAKKKREAVTKPLRFCFVGKKQLTSDPLVFLKRMAKSTVSNVRFEDYRATCHVIPCDITCAIAEYILSIKQPPEKVAKVYRKAIRQRTRFEFNPNTRKAQKIVDELRELIDVVAEGSDNAISLWYTAINPIVQGPEPIATTLVDLLEFGPQHAVWEAEQEKRVGATQALKIEQAARDQIESDIRNTVLDQLKRAAVRSRRKNSGTSEADKSLRKELSEIAKRLEAAKS